MLISKEFNKKIWQKFSLKIVINKKNKNVKKFIKNNFKLLNKFLIVKFLKPQMFFNENKLCLDNFEIELEKDNINFICRKGSYYDSF